MIDSKMTDILKNFASVENGTGEITDAITGETKVSTAATEKNAMKALLEGLDSAQRSVNQMPAQHKMAQNTATKHPASKFLVGGEEGDPNTGEVVAEQPEENVSDLTPEDVVAAWKRVFPNSSVSASKAFGGGYAFKFRLAKDKSEVSSGIMDNDPLSYTAFLEPDGSWRETQSSMFVAPPEGSHLAYGREKFRKKRAKKVTPELLQKRFNDVRNFVAANADKLHNVSFDIDEKLGSGTVNEAKSADNFTADDLQALNNIRDLDTLKQRAMELISNPNTTKPMKPEKVAWFRSHIERKTNPAAIIKMMWDLFLAGEGSKVIGSPGSMKSNAYRSKFGEDTLGKRTPGSDVHKKQSLADIFRSMDEAEEEKEANLEREFHSKLQKEKALKQGQNGKYDLAEGQLEDLDDLRAQIKNMAFFGQDNASIVDEFKTNNGDTFVVLAKKIVKLVREINADRKGKGDISEENLSEKSAPGQEDWIKAHKKEFIDQYGKEKGLSVLYATAWKRHNQDK